MKSGILKSVITRFLYIESVIMRVTVYCRLRYGCWFAGNGYGGSESQDTPCLQIQNTDPFTETCSMLMSISSAKKHNDLTVYAID